MRNNSDTSSPQSRLMEMLNEQVVVEPIENILEKIQLQLITGLEELAPPAYDFSELDKIFGKFQKNKVSTKSEYARLILDIVTYFIQTVKNVSINREDYTRLQQQTQDIEKKIREHIKIENKLKLEFDIRDRASTKLREENQRLKEENKHLKETITDLQRRLHQQLKIFVSKMGKNIQLDKHFYTHNQMLNNQKIHIKDPGERPSPNTQIFNQKHEGKVLEKYHQDFNQLLFDIRKQDGRQKRPQSLE